MRTLRPREAHTLIAESPKPLRNRGLPWWKDHEKVAYLFEILLKPFETQIHHNTRQRDIVGIFRQLDVGVIGELAGETRVKSFVEVQKRKTKVTIQALGD